MLHVSIEIVFIPCHFVLLTFLSDAQIIWLLLYRYARCTRSVSIGMKHFNSNNNNNNNSPVLNSVNHLLLCHVMHTQICWFCFAVPPAYYAHLAAFRARYYMEGDSSDSGSTSSGGGNVEIQRLPSIKENVKDVMFYC